MKRWVLTAALFVVVLGIVAAAAVGAFSTGKSQARADGIAVHGNWVMTVRNPNGALVRRYRFHNELWAGVGDASLSDYLSRANTPGFWLVTLQGSDAPCLSGTSATSCYLLETADTAGFFASAPYATRNMTVAQSGGTVVLEGSTNAQRDGTITNVNTWQQRCPNTVSPTALCGTIAYYGFTQRTLATPITLVTGQQLQVKITFSFS